jgi:hypothetical protein
MWTDSKMKTAGSPRDHELQRLVDAKLVSSGLTQAVRSSRFRDKNRRCIGKPQSNAAAQGTCATAHLVPTRRPEIQRVH